MPFTQAWYVKDHIVMVKLSGKLTVEDIAQSFRASAKFISDSSASRVHFIHDWSELLEYPTNISQIRQAVAPAPDDIKAKIGMVVIYGTTQESLKFLGDLTFQLFQIRTHRANNFDAALELIYRHDHGLPAVAPFHAPTDVSWYLEGHILYCYNVVDTNQMIIRNRNAYELMEAEGKPPYVHMLIDFATTDMDDFHSDVRDLIRWSASSPEFEQARDNLIQHPLFGWVVTIGVDNRNINLSGKIIAQRYNYKRKNVDTLQEALTFLKQIDPNIARLLSNKT